VIRKILSLDLKTDRQRVADQNYLWCLSNGSSEATQHLPTFESRLSETLEDTTDTRAKAGSTLPKNQRHLQQQRTVAERCIS